jgi:hypothetical protein
MPAILATQEAEISPQQIVHKTLSQKKQTKKKKNMKQD